MTTTDVIVIGSGPAGLAAASEIAGSGYSVVVLEREAQPGGVPRHCHNPSFGLAETGRPNSGPAFARRMTKRAIAAGADVRTSTTVLELDPERLAVGVVSPTGATSWTARAMVLATGARERTRHARRIPGARPDGIMTTGELQQHTNIYGRPVGQRAVVYGAEHVSFSALMTLRKSGIDPVAVVTPQPSHQTFAALKLYTTRFGRVPLLTSTSIASIEGSRRVTGVWLNDLGGTEPSDTGHPEDLPRVAGERRESENFIPCDTVVMTGDWVAEGDLAVRSGVECDISLGGVPYVNDGGSTSARGIFAAGAVTHPGESADRAVKSGRATGAKTVSFLNGFMETRQVPVVCDNDVFRWLTPHWVTPGSPTEIRFRVDKWFDRPRINASQGDRGIDSKRFRRTIPGRTYSLPSDWVRRLDPDDPLRLTITDYD